MGRSNIFFKILKGIAFSSLKRTSPKTFMSPSPYLSLETTRILSISKASYHSKETIVCIKLLCMFMLAVGLEAI